MFRATVVNNGSMPPSGTKKIKVLNELLQQAMCEWMDSLKQEMHNLCREPKFPSRHEVFAFLKK